MKDLDLTTGIYIPSIEAKWVYKANTKKFNYKIKKFQRTNKVKSYKKCKLQRYHKGNYEVDNEFLDKLLNGKLDYSFEFVENKELIDGIEIMEMEDGKLYTFDVVNVKYTKMYLST